MVQYGQSKIESINEAEESDPNTISEGRKSLLSSLEDFLLGSEGILFAFDALLYCLAKHPDVQAKMREEIEKVKER